MHIEYFIRALVMIFYFSKRCLYTKRCYVSSCSKKKKEDAMSHAIYIYIYIEREREREKQKLRVMLQV